MTGLITPDGRQAGAQKRAIPAEAIIDQFFSNITNAMMMTMFVEYFSKAKAESVVMNAYQNELNVMRGFFEQIGTHDPGSSGKLKMTIEQAFEVFKEQLLSLYPEGDIQSEQHT